MPGGISPNSIDPIIGRFFPWEVVDRHHPERIFRFKNFREILDFTNRVGEPADDQGHHPDIFPAWGKVVLTLWACKIDGLSYSDFVLAAKLDDL